MGLKEHKLIFSNFPHERKLRFNYIDVGARGDIEEPWSLLNPETLRVIGFEPDPEEAKRLSERFPDRSYYGTGLWSEKRERTFYLCKLPEISSMYPPNEKHNLDFLKRHHENRVPVREVPVQCDALDNVLLEKDKPDFIKIDTQGSEFEIIQGAKRVLTENIPLVVTETWCSEIYKGAPMTHDVLRIMHELGYQPMDVNVAAAWQRENREGIEIESKAGTVGLDFLFMRRPEFLKDANADQLLKFVCLSELYGFRDYALSALENSSQVADDDRNNVRELLLRLNESELAARRHNASRKTIWKQRLRRLLRLPSTYAPAGIYPRLHY